MKKQYIKPTMQVYEIKGRSQLLAGSDPYPADIPLGYTPGISEKKNRLA